jgi:hypothetical protein
MKLCVVNIYENKIHEDEWRVVMQFSDPDIAQVTGTVKYRTLKEARDASERLANALDHEEKKEKESALAQASSEKAQTERELCQAEAGFDITVARQLMPKKETFPLVYFATKVVTDEIQARKKAQKKRKKAQKKEIKRLAAIDEAIFSLIKGI